MMIDLCIDFVVAYPILKRVKFTLITAHLLKENYRASYLYTRGLE